MSDTLVSDPGILRIYSDQAINNKEENMSKNLIGNLEHFSSQSDINYTPGSTDPSPSQIQRWFISRKYGENPDDPQLDIEIAYASDKLLKKLSPETENDFLALKSDNLDWWEEEEMLLRMSQFEFLKQLDLFSDFLQDKTLDERYIEEGMVFLYIDLYGMQKPRPRYIHFTHQARTMSNLIYSRLMGETTESE
jgi:hypothetical protein